MLSQRLNLSNAAMSAIIDELKTKGYIKEVEGEAPANGVGRRPVYYAVNERFGCVVVISLMDYVVRVVVSDMVMNITDSVEARVERYDVAMLYEIVLIVKNLLNSPKYRETPLLGIDFSVPGRVNTLTGELQLSPQFDKELFSEKNYIVNLFTRQFDAPVVLTNDINLAGLGELHGGLLKNVENGLLVHVDEGIGGALIIGKKLYAGTRGFAGEVGLIHTQFDGRNEKLDEFVSLRAVRESLGKALGRELTSADVARLYKTDGQVKEYINGTARCLGKVLKDIVELLDISVIVLSGRIREFGEEYLAIVNEEVSQSINDAQALYSLLGRDAPVTGAVSKAVEALTDDLFR